MKARHATLSLKIFTALFFFAHSAQALVDMRNANYSETWTDIEFETGNYDLRIQRTYNSRTLFKGVFGFGWCTEFETKLNVTALNTVLVTECGAGSEVEYSAGKMATASADRIIDQIIAEMKKKEPSRDKKYFENLAGVLRMDVGYRERVAQELKIQGTVEVGKKYYASGRTNDYIEYRGKDEILRYLPNGSIQEFNQTGQLTQIKDRSGNAIKVSYKDKRISQIIGSNGASLNFKYSPDGNFVSEINGPNNMKSTYKYSGETLVTNVNAANQKFEYKYDDLYNMTRVDFPDKTYLKVTYDKDRDWVTEFRDRRGCVESYTYKDDPKDPLNSYSSEVLKKCDGKITNQSQYEFKHKKRKDGTTYLASTKSVVNGVTTEIQYHEIYGRPVMTSTNGNEIHFEYFPNGLVKTRAEPHRTMRYQHDNVCRKVSEVSIQFTIQVPDPKANGKKSRQPTMKTESRTAWTKYQYNPKSCVLVSAKTSEGQTVALDYDRQGRIVKITDQTKKIVSIAYEDRFGKPAKVTRPGLGTINFIYKNNGEVDRIDSKSEPLVAVQVANVFQNLIDIINPATTDTSI